MGILTVAGYRHIEEIAHGIDADVGKDPAVLPEKGIEIAVPATKIQHAARAYIAQLQQGLEALALTVIILPAQRFTGILAEAGNSLAVISLDRGQVLNVHRRPTSLA